MRGGRADEGPANDRYSGVLRFFSIVGQHRGMPRVRAAAAVQYPAKTAQRLLAKFMDERRRGDGSIRLPLRVALREGHRDGLSFEREVVMRFRLERDPKNLNDTFYIDWVPFGGGPYPTFSGFMNVCADADSRVSRIEIDGTYMPPGGLLGRTFDAVLGNRMARASLADFVKRLACDIDPAMSSNKRF
jgi:hypothetical protein